MRLNPELLEEARELRRENGPGGGLFLISEDGTRMMRVEKGSHLLTVGDKGEAVAHSMSDIMACVLTLVFDPPPVATFSPED